ncbi:MAG TPA: hypothetical protein VFI65_12540 [Streptosporangiaceae bacterium]|nr:hypothetical protein [Streptosporangiaceae bacterium]
MASATGSSAEQAKGPGKASDALTGLSVQAGHLPAEPTPDPNVATAYALGWAVGEALTCAEYGVFKHLPAVPEFTSDADRWKLVLRQITSRCKLLDAYLKDTKTGLNLNAQADSAAKLQLGSANQGDAKNSVQAKKDSVAELHAGIIEVLWSAETPLGKSYWLGHEMEQMCTNPFLGQSRVGDSVRKHAHTIHSLLGSLASRLPANAAHATDNSLRLWSASLNAGADESAAGLLDQGRRWREVLAGDVAGKDGLRLSDYVAAADGMAGRLWATARQVLARFRLWLIIVIVVALAGIALIVWGTRGALGAGIASLVAAFGLTWKGIGEFFGRAAAKGEQELWDAEIDWAIAYRFTILQNAPAGKDLKQLNCDQPTKKHLQRYNEWKQTWPDVDFPSRSETA